MTDVIFVCFINCLLDCSDERLIFSRILTDYNDQIHVNGFPYPLHLIPPDGSENDTILKSEELCSLKMYKVLILVV